MKIAKKIDKYRLISLGMSKSELCPFKLQEHSYPWCGHHTGLRTMLKNKHNPNLH